jgi:hypothetical protein
MALSPNYGWAEPDNSSLVKNGAQDIRALGDAIDTSVWNVGYGQAGKNKIINGDFSINQRQFTSVTTTGTFGFDRFRISASDGTVTYTPQTFTTGTAPVAGYEGTNFARIVTTGQTLATARADLNTPIESVKTFAGQTVTVSFWAKAATGTPKVAVELGQNFGSGGSPSAYNPKYFGQVTLSTSWARYSVTATLDSLSGKTIGTSTDQLAVLLFVSAGSNLNARTGTLGIQSNTFDFWGIQAEYGSKATPFQLAGGGDPQSELAMCQRYYAPAQFGIGQAAGSTTVITMNYNLPVEMRTSPSATLVSGTSAVTLLGTGNQNVTSISINASATRSMVLLLTGTGYTSNGIYTASQSGKIEFSAEL